MFSGYDQARDLEYEEKQEMKKKSESKREKFLTEKGDGKTKYKVVEFDRKTAISEAIFQAIETIREEKMSDLYIVIKLYSSSKELTGLGVMFKPNGEDAKIKIFIPIQFEEGILLPDQILISYR